MLVDQVGVWTLKRPGYAKLFYELNPTSPSRSFSFRLPFGASEGPFRWYLIRLHFSIAIDPRSGPGTVNVVGYTNGSAAALFEFIVTRSSRGPSVEWSTLDLLEGFRKMKLKGLTTSLRFRNFLQFSGVRSGDNALTFTIRSLGARAKSVRIFNDSGLEVSRRGPSTLRANLRLEPNSVAVGSRVIATWSLLNIGGRPARRVSVGLDFDPAYLAPVGPVSRQLGTVTGSAHGSFVLRALAHGSATVFLSAASTGNRPGAEAKLDIR